MARSPSKRAEKPSEKSTEKRPPRASEVVPRDPALGSAPDESFDASDEETGVRSRLDYDALGGTSESEARWASGEPEFEPNPSEDLEPDMRSNEGGTGRARRGPGGSPTEEELAVGPDDLGRRFLEGATQDLRPTEANPGDGWPPEEEDFPGLGERRTRGQAPGGDDDDRSPLLTRFPDRSEIEQAISDKARELQARASEGEEEEPSPEDHVTPLDRDPRYEHDRPPPKRRPS